MFVKDLHVSRLALYNEPIDAKNNHFLCHIISGVTTKMNFFSPF